ncbi:hypothetical protein [Nocardioides sp. cx-173]|uniref:hypothetical protein n=1 Tax=Nocardioides sp. cx-173 TaxID=2898796 RepID=UPI001E48DFED|nr:hypothetical protein [Nocardioides sp. cx-173]MCD4527459.1 hypothetical protein [Nocardioides sp. cx-173]UGB40401.1 hypothetical protein LQ940_13545 [Nocardioides sp. cx-173]
MQRRLGSLLALLITLSGLTAVTIIAAAPAHAICDHDRTYFTTPDKGRRVWIPTNDFSVWKKGGSITRSESGTKSTARTKGRSHSISVSGEVGAQVGPLSAGVTTTYDETHSTSTTNESSITKGWDYHFKIPGDGLYRARLYKLGWIYKYKRVDTYLGGCKPKKTRLYGAAPVKKNTNSVYYWAREKKANAGKYRYDSL